MRVSAAALRWVDKAGGLDNYLLFTAKHKLQSAFAVDLKQRIVAARAASREAAAAAAASSPEEVAALERAAVLRADDAAFPGSLWEDQVQDGQLPPLAMSRPTTHHVTMPPDAQDAQREAAGAPTWKNAWELAEEGGGEPDPLMEAGVLRPDGWYRWKVPSGRIMLLTKAQYELRVASAAALARTRIPILGKPNQRPPAIAMALNSHAEAR